MCEPLTIAAIGTSVIGMGMQASAISAHAADAAATSRRNAAEAERQAADAVQRGVIPEMRARMQGGRFIGEQIGHYSGTNVDVNIGSPKDVQASTRAISDMDEEVIRNNARREAYGYGTQAQRYQQEANFDEAEGKNALLASVIGGVGKLATIGAKSWMESNPGGGNVDWPAGAPPPAPEV